MAKAAEQRDEVEAMSDMEILRAWLAVQIRAARQDASDRFLRGMAEAYEIVSMRIDRMQDERSQTQTGTADENISTGYTATATKYLP